MQTIKFFFLSIIIISVLNAHDGDHKDRHGHGNKTAGCIIYGTVLDSITHKPIELNQKTHFMLISIAISLIVNLCGNIIFLPKYGLIITAYTFILSGAVYIISSLILSFSFYKTLFIKRDHII